MCDYRYSKTEELKNYRIDVKNSTGQNHILKVTNRDKECNVSTNLPSESVQCICLEANGVVCKISEISLENKNAQWTCAVTNNKKVIVFSDAANVLQGKCLVLFSVLRKISPLQ